MQWEHKRLLKHIQNFTNIYEVEGIPKSQLETLEKMLPELSTKQKIQFLHLTDGFRLYISNIDILTLNGDIVVVM